MINRVMNSSTLLAGGRAVDLVNALPVDAAEAEHAKTGEALKVARARQAQLKTAHARVDEVLTGLRRERELAIAGGVRKLLAVATGECPESSTILQPEIRHLAEIDGRQVIAATALSELIIEILPAAEESVLMAEAAHLDAAAGLVDSRRYGRLREFNESLSALADSEHQVEIRSQRFDAEGLIRDEHRTGAATKRRELELKRTQWQALRTAMKG